MSEQLEEISIEEAKEKIARMLNDPYGSHGINAIKRLFASLLDCSMGLQVGVGKGGPMGVLDEYNRQALRMVLSDEKTTIELCHMIYYGQVIAVGEEE